MSDAGYVFLVLGIMFAAFASDRFRLDLVAGAALLALAVPGVLDPAQALAGFAEPITLMIAGLFVVGAGLFQTGVADRIGDLLGRAGTGPLRLTVVTMGVAALLSGFLSSTGTVAVLLPVVVGLARRAGMAPAKLLMPLAFGSLLGGMLTLIGTPPNLVVADVLRQEGREPFGFFAFTPVGLTMLAIGILYMTTIGRRLLPDRDASATGAAPTVRELARRYEVEDRLRRVRVGDRSPLRDRTVAENDLRRTTGVTVLAIESVTGSGRSVRRSEPSSLLRAGDVLHLIAEPEALDRIVREGLVEATDAPRTESLPEAAMLIEVVVPPGSAYEGKPLREARMHDRTRATVLAIRRGERLVQGSELTDVTVQAGDLALLAGGPDAQRRVVRAPNDLIPVATPREWERFARDTSRAPHATLVLAGMLAAMTFGWLPNVVAVLAAAFAMVALGAVRPTEAYRTVHWETVVLIAAVLPMATALDVTGGLDLITSGLTGVLGDAGPVAVMAALFLLTSVLSQAISNTATTVLVAPLAAATAAGLNVAPEPLLMTVAVAASTAFATPVASPVNALVLGPGDYRFGDFVKVGLPVVAAMMVATLLVVPLLFPLAP